MTRTQPFTLAQISPPEAPLSAAKGTAPNRIAPTPATSGPLPLVGRDGVGGSSQIQEAQDQ